MGQGKHQQLDRLIEQVSRGERELSSIRDPEQREKVRIALRLHKEAASEPDAYTRIRMRARVLGTLHPRRPTLRDHAWTALELVAKPAPYIMRGVAIASVLVCLGMGAIVASADTLPDDLLYPMKLGAESMRLALADAPSDRAMIELSVAEHRLREAERLAASGRSTDALVASAMYSQHIAWAAADLAPDAPSDLAQQLEVRFDGDRSRASALASSLSTDQKSAGAARILALIAQPTGAPGDTGMERVASTAAGVAEQLVQVAEQDAASAPDTASDPSASPVANGAATSGARGDDASPSEAKADDPSLTPKARASDARTPRPSESARAETARPSATAGERPDAHKANEALQRVRKALEEAKAAADKAKSHHR